MNQELDAAPCGYISVDDKGTIISVNQTLLDLVGFNREELVGSSIDVILPLSARAFYQIYFFPMIKVQRKIEEMYIVLKTSDGTEIPVLLNAKRGEADGKVRNDCVFIPMYKRNEFEKELIAARKEAERLLAVNQAYQRQIEQELTLARSMQSVTIPGPLEGENFKVLPFYRPSTQLSGDVYGYYPLSENKLAVIIVDVMGHGISSALVTMYLRSTYQSALSNESDVGRVADEMDAALHALFKGHHDVKHYATMLLAVIDLEEKKLEYMNAGHPTAFVVEDTGTGVAALESIVPPIGMFEGIDFTSNVFEIQSNGRLLLYTDGVSDVVPEKKLKKLLEEGKQEPLDVIHDNIVNCLELHSDADDDQCFILLEWN